MFQCSKKCFLKIFKKEEDIFNLFNFKRYHFLFVYKFMYIGFENKIYFTFNIRIMSLFRNIKIL